MPLSRRRSNGVTAPGTRNAVTCALTSPTSAHSVCAAADCLVRAAALPRSHPLWPAIGLRWRCGISSMRACARSRQTRRTFINLACHQRWEHLPKSSSSAMELPHTACATQSRSRDLGYPRSHPACHPLHLITQRPQPTPCAADVLGIRFFRRVAGGSSNCAAPEQPHVGRWPVLQDI